MTAPELIWVNTDNREDGCCPVETEQNGDGRFFNGATATSYTRTDLIPSDPRVMELVEAATVTLHDIDDLVANSEGVAGLHLNGNVACWESLMDGGAFGAWLSSVEKLRLALAALKGAANE